jgi:hypothetical protein
MPSHLRIFFWLVAAIALYWVLSMLWVMQFPPAAMTAALAKIPAAMREQIKENAWRITLITTLIRVVIFVGLAFLAAFRRQNWARLLLLTIVIFMHLGPFIIAERLGRVQEFLMRYSDLQADIVTLLLVLALVFAFTGDARGAFVRPPRAA